MVLLLVAHVVLLLWLTWYYCLAVYSVRFLNCLWGSLWGLSDPPLSPTLCSAFLWMSSSTIHNKTWLLWLETTDIGYSTTRPQTTAFSNAYTNQNGVTSSGTPAVAIFLYPPRESKMTMYHNVPDRWNGAVDNELLTFRSRHCTNGRKV